MIPITYILGVSLVMDVWHNPDEVQNILVGLALVASMPIAGSSTAWSQNADGDLALSLGLVLGSTLLSPFTTPLALHAVGLMATGDYAEDLHEIASRRRGGVSGGGGDLAVAAGNPLRQAVGERRIAVAKPALKLVNIGVLLFLNYSNAAVSLPQAIAEPDLDFLAAILTIVVGLCVLTFAAGWGIAQPLADGSRPAHRLDVRAGHEQQRNRAGHGLARAWRITLRSCCRSSSTTSSSTSSPGAADRLICGKEADSG